MISFFKVSFRAIDILNDMYFYYYSGVFSINFFNCQVKFVPQSTTSFPCKTVAAVASLWISLVISFTTFLSSLCELSSAKSPFKFK